MSSWSAASNISIPYDLYYPESSVKAGETGTVEVVVVVSSKNTILAAAILKSSGFANLDHAALKMIKNSTVKSPVCSGESSEVELVIPVQFKLRQ